MLIRDMFERDITREIQGVIKVGQNDEESRYHELEEYVVTRELLKHFSLFYDNYRKSLDKPTDEMGVWISGFFGSGKSHFLKILSYLLDNEPVQGQKPVDFFESKIKDAALYAEMKRAARFDCETILFNIDSKSPLGNKSDKEAILKVFLKVFYDHLGYYGDDFRVVELEKYLQRDGKLEAFQQNFLDISGQPWTERRNCFFFEEDAIVEALIKTTGMSETNARNWYNQSNGASVSIEQFAREVKEYIATKGEQFHLIFLVDEIGQYIGDNAQLMLNLQTLVEDLGIHCQGRVWVIVTSQEDIDSVTKVKGNDFSKIQGRFKTRLGLSSASVDEVIKERLLKKKAGYATDKLTLIYNDHAAALKNLLHFSQGTVADLKGYAGEDEFCTTYPFVPYQFKLLQNVFTQIRKHGASGKHLAEGERSMLSAFQDAAGKMADDEAGVLVPFYAFYDSVHEFLDGSIQRVIARGTDAAHKGDVLKVSDVDVLKLLFLIRYIGDIPANIDNIATLMISRIEQDKLGLKADIRQSLDRLTSQNYIQKNAEEYRFLTDDEQDINREIKNTDVDKGLVVGELGKYFFNDIYEDQKYKYSPRYNFAFNSRIDETSMGAQTARIGLRILTLDSDDYDADEARLKIASGDRNDLIIRLDDKTDYFEEMQEAVKIERFSKLKTPNEAQSTYKIILAEKQEEAAQRRKRARSMLEEAIYNGRYYVNGEKITPRGASVKERINSSLKMLVESVFSKLPYIIEFVDSDADIQAILKSTQSQEALMGQSSDPNHLASREIMAYIDMQDIKHVQVNMKNLLDKFEDEPYGWREIDIAALTARLFKNQKIRLQYQGGFLETDHKDLVAYLRKKTEVEKLVVKKRATLPAAKLKLVRELSKELFNVIDLPKDEDGLIKRFLEEVAERRKHLHEEYLFYYASKDYPGQDIIKKGVDIFKKIEASQNDHVVLLGVLGESEGQLLDWDDEMKLVEGFFKTQRPIFDKGLEMSKRILANHSYLQEDEFRTTSGELNAILENSNPYKEIVKIPDLLAFLEKRFDTLLEIKKVSSTGILNGHQAELTSAAGNKHLSDSQSSDFKAQIDKWYSGKYQYIKDSLNFESLDAATVQSADYKKKILEKIKQTIMDNQPPDTPPVRPPQIHVISLNDLATVKTLATERDIDRYVADLADKLKQIIQQNKVIKFEK